MQGDIAERGAADADDDKIVATRLDLAGKRYHFIGEFHVAGQLAKAERRLLHRVRGGGELRAEGVKFGIGDAMLADTLGHQVVEIVA